ncbi:MAG: 30S ribosomal protein S3 [Ruminococcaceae bacterium]|nr:30S ribosomal protein S3 [Oscillospiraceae bacterium]
MGQKVNPNGLRVGVIRDWNSRWFVEKKHFGDTLVEDFNIRKYLKKKLYSAGIPKIEIERTFDAGTGAPRVKINIFCAKPGMVIGRGGTEIDKLRLEIEGRIKKSVNLNIIEIRNADTNAQLVAENIAQQLERRIAFRRAMKQSIGRAMRFGAKGIKCQVGGRLNGADIARSEHYHEGTIPLQTLRADIDYGFAEANTTYGKIGVKVWIYKGEVLKGTKPLAEIARPPQERRDRRPRNDRPRGDRPQQRREGGNR